MTKPQVSLDEALRYDKNALLAEIEKRKDNIKIFQDAIDNEEIEIERLKQMVVLIEANESLKR
jgi:hypothetical protein